MTHIIRILSLCLLFIGVGVARGWAQTDSDDYDPTNPAEPMVVDYCRVIVEANPAEGAYVSGGGKYRMGGSTSYVYISTSARNTDDWNYNFLYWTLNGEPVSTNRNFYYTLQKGVQHFVAHYEKREVIYDPTNPAEPSGQLVHRKYRLYLESTLPDACAFNIASGERQAEGSTIYLRIYPNADYKFEGWRIDGTIVSTSPTLYYTMPNHEVHIEAVLTETPYAPANPNEPSSGGGNIDTGGDEGGDIHPVHERQLITLSFGIPGISVDKTRVVFNNAQTLLYDSNCDAAKFFSGSANYQIYTVGEDALRYQINERPIDNGRVTLGVMAKTSGTVQIAADRLDCQDAVLIDKFLGIEHSLAAGPYIFETTAGTFEDRFELVVPAMVCDDDANGDGRVSIVDVAILVSRLWMSATPADVQRAADKVLEK